MKFFDRVLLYLLVGATLSIAYSMERGGPPSGKTAAAGAVTAVALFWPLIFVAGYIAAKDELDAEKKAAEPTP